MTEKDELMLKGEDADGAANAERPIPRAPIAPPYKELTLSTEARPLLGAGSSSSCDKVTFPIAALPAARDDRPHLLVLCGVVGSGKSSFAQSLCSLQRPRYIRASQDVLGDRRSVISLVSQHLSQRSNVVVDRTNADASQRAYWLDLGQQYGAKTDIIVFDTPFSTCQARLRARKDHETLKSPAQALNQREARARLGASVLPPSATHLELRVAAALDFTCHQSSMSNLRRRLRRTEKQTVLPAYALPSALF
ncbi:POLYNUCLEOTIDE KINASE-3'-PHOSPHATASE [Ceraceosorus bombacis]|uniref:POLYNUCLEOTIDE KINASE-3'-PHOSPHATASE n=1 Tax=Ceraceosorus bombacis TaxID=401625 RepID=A0A0P1B9U3_9BASI|nr:POLYNUCLEOTIDE KINASE-3'-PHOSPHATASE [Ceraceosorus bombacis]